MANLPDLDTTQVSFMTYWNAISEGGVSSVDPTEVVSSGNVNSYDTYDNGVEGKYSISNAGRSEVNFRVKSDGWMIAWIDRREQTGNGVSAGNLIGPWDIAFSWTDVRGTSEVEYRMSDQGTLQRAIDNLKSQFSNSGSISFAYSEVGFYNFEYPTATNLHHGDEREGVQTNTRSISRSEGTSLPAFWVCGGGNVSFNGRSLGQFSALNVVDEGLAPAEGETINAQVDSDGNCIIEALYA